jgi:hypothetical protein
MYDVRKCHAKQSWDEGEIETQSWPTIQCNSTKKIS